MDWCKINDEGEIEFLSEEVKLVSEVQAILALNYNKGPNDSQGRNRYRAKAEMKYLYLNYSYKSPYKDYSESERRDEAKKDCKFNHDWTESPELKALIPKFVKGNQSKVGRLLERVEKFLDKFEDHLDKINLDERNMSGGLVHDPAKIMNTLQKLPAMAQTIQELEQQVRLGMVGTTRSKGDHELGWQTGDVKKIEEEDDDGS